MTLDAPQADLVRAARATLDRARQASSATGPHRSLRRLRFTPATLVELLLMAALPSAALVYLQPWLMAFWHSLILWWAQGLDIPLGWVAGPKAPVLQWLDGGPGSLVPDALTGVLTAVLVMGTFAATFWLGDRQLPLKYLVRTLCAVQASALLFFMLWPSQLPYTVPGHLEAMLDAGYFLMLALPSLLALGWGVLQVPAYQKLLYPPLMLAYFALMLPHKALLHMLILQHFSVLFMPLLYLCFGAVFDLMVFVALYSWLASRVPASATGEHATS